MPVAIVPTASAVCGITDIPPETKDWPGIQSAATRSGPGALILVGLLSIGALQLQANWPLAGGNRPTLQQSLMTAFAAAVQDMRSRWYGAPVLWRPPPISNTDMLFFTVSGSTQQQLIDSFTGANICAKYGTCSPDPASPNGVALGIEYFRPAALSYACYSPSTTTLAFREVVVLPRWSPPPDGTVRVQVVERWNALEQVIYTHEAGHVAITKQDLFALNNRAHHLASCNAVNAFWNRPSTFNKMQADQLAYHARLRADCRPEVGCFTAGWMGW